MTITTNQRHDAAFLIELDREVERHDVPVTGGHVTWRRFGNAGGTPLVLLHGGHGRWGHWARNIRPLTARYTLWVPDLPGYGEGVWRSGPFIASTSTVSGYPVLGVVTP